VEEVVLSPPSPKAQTHCTLLQLVSYLTALGASEQDTVEIVLELLRSGRVRLTGSFRSRPFWSEAALDRRH
jgi:hypothetical protein